MTADRTAELRQAIADAEVFATLEEAASDELDRLWHDLDSQLRLARDGCWSMGCEDIAHRIVALTRTLGRPARWQDMPLGLLEAGVYQRMHDLLGMPYDPPDMDTVAQSRARLQEAQ
ncbi:hypothetical protein [Streptosporangium jomthongense]|uniref:Uncharacterized protein n=1 Tax=Streptosporangium jomthongense TaxID=1193683 RepID=A0ABV8FCR8_9ACTN